MILSTLAALALFAPVDEALPDDVAAAVKRGAEILVERQENYEPDPPVGRLEDADLAPWQVDEEARLAKLRSKARKPAEWPYEGVYRVAGGVIPAGYRVGGTAIACEALLAAPDFDESKEQRAAVERAVVFILDELRDNRALEAGPKVGYDVRGWGHAYALRTLLLVVERGAVDGHIEKRIVKAIPDLIERIEVNAVPDGGWNYANQRTSPFMTGSTLLTLYLARSHGYDVDATIVEKALDGLERGRTERGSFAYSGALRGAVAMPGSSARSSVAELALYLAGRSSQDELEAAVEGFFVGWVDLLTRKSRQGTHVGQYAIAPYYFFFGHSYAGLAIEQLPVEARDDYRGRLHRVLWATREPDGRWNDRVFPRTSAYGTSMAMLAFAAPMRRAFPAWASTEVK